jgi:hypothetical protein
MAFEDWYVLENSAALDAINMAAVSGRCEAPHDEVAAWSRDEATGLYRLRGGMLAPGEAVHAYWCERGPDQSHGQLLETLTELAPAEDYALWSRQMGLSPAPEFCLRSRLPLELPTGIAPAATRELSLRPLWP